LHHVSELLMTKRLALGVSNDIMKH